MSILDYAPLVVALAMLVGVIAQALGRHILVPGIVMLLVAGVLLGPDVANGIRPAALGSALSTLVGFAVAVIMFEGGMRLELGRLRKQARVIRRLVLLGALVTAIGGTFACLLIMGWDVRRSILFGTLVMVTGPTVIAPLVRRIRLAPTVATILEAEGVFIDAVGAMTAVMALEIALSPSSATISEAVLGVVQRIGVGVLIGTAGGFALSAVLRVPRLVPRGLENILALGAAVTLYELSHALVHESGIPAAMMAGLVVGNMRVRRLDELVEFKEQLTVLLIGTLFVLLAADVRLADIQALGWRALIVVAVLSFVVRPIGVALCTRGTELTGRERLYLSWVAPRGIVAAAVASLFAEHLAMRGFAGGMELRALVFTVIAVTVAVQGLTAGPVASLLGLRRAQPRGYVFLGANPLARHLARRLADAGEPVELIDFDDADTAATQAVGLKVIHGNGLEARTLIRARVDSRNYAVALTSNEGVNLLFARQVAEDFYGPRLLVAIDTRDIGVQPAMLEDLDARVVFGRPADLGAWIGRWRHNHVELASYTGGSDLFAAPHGVILPLLSERDGHVHLINASTTFSEGDVVELAIAHERRDEAAEWLVEHGWKRVAADDAEPVLHGEPCPSSLPIPSDSSAPATWPRR